MSEDISLKPYYVRFTLVYIALIIALAFLRNVFASNLSGVSFLLPMFAAMFSGEFFLKKQKRLPTNDEKFYLTWVSFTIFLIINLIFIGLMFLANGGVSGLAELNENGTSLGIIFTVIVLVIVVVTYGSIQFGYGGLTNRRAKFILKEDAD